MTMYQVPAGFYGIAFNRAQIRRFVDDPQYSRTFSAFRKAALAAIVNSENETRKPKFKWLYLEQIAGAESGRSQVGVELEITSTTPSGQPSIIEGDAIISLTPFLKQEVDVSDEAQEDLEQNIELQTHDVECSTGDPIGAWPGGPRRFATYLPIAFFIDHAQPGDEYLVHTTLRINDSTWELPTFSVKCDDHGILQPLDGLVRQIGAILLT